MNDATVKKVEMLESKPDYIMEPTRTGSFDDEMYMNVLYNSEAIDAFAKTMNRAAETINKASKVTERQNEALQKLTDFLNEENEQIEQQIADSHDITKSNFGFK